MNKFLTFFVTLLCIVALGCSVTTLITVYNNDKADAEAATEADRTVVEVEADDLKIEADDLKIKVGNLEVILQDQVFILRIQAEQNTELRDERGQLLQHAGELKTQNTDLRHAGQVALDYITELERAIERLRRELDNHLID